MVAKNARLELEKNLGKKLFLQVILQPIILRMEVVKIHEYILRKNILNWITIR